MKTLLSTVLVLLLPSGLWAPFASQPAAFVEPTGAQIAFGAYFGDCLAGADCTSGNPTLEPLLMDVDGSHEIAMPIGAWSPDGTRLLVSRNYTQGDQNDIYLVSATGGTRENLTRHPAAELTPAWSPDGTRIAFASNRDGPFDLYIMNADGSNVVRIPTGTRRAWQPTWSPDGGRLAFTCVVDPPLNAWTPPEDGNHDICVIATDGSGLARLTIDPRNDNAPDWSPDGLRILFGTTRYGYPEIVVMSPDGNDLARIVPGLEAETPRWSPDGTRIAFTYLALADNYEWYVRQPFVSFVNLDGTGFTSLAWGIDPVWRPIGGGANVWPVAAFTFECSGLTCSFDASPSTDADGSVVSYGWHFGDGTTAAGQTVTHTFAGRHDVRLVVMDDRGALADTARNVNQLPVASLAVACTGLTCTFDGSASFDPDGRVAVFGWLFGDSTQQWSTSPTMIHRYPAAGTYIVTLRVLDEDGYGGEASQALTITGTPTINASPIPSFVFSCSELTCAFDASSSSDPDGTIAKYTWSFGDGTTGAGAIVSRAYARAGGYAVTLSVIDNESATGTLTRIVDAIGPLMHVGDLDGASTVQHGTWTATVTISIHDSAHAPVPNAVVAFRWSDGAESSCTTNAAGRCTVSRSGFARKATASLTVTGAWQSAFFYDSASNHDVDGDSDGTTIGISRR